MTLRHFDNYQNIKTLEKADSLSRDLTWRIYANPGERFPYRLFIEEEPGTFLHLKTQERWPGPGKNIFCTMEGKILSNELPKEEALEECRIISKRYYGKKLSLVLDRKIRKRCWFIFLKKEYKQKPGEFYDQVFWITRASAVAGRRGAYLSKRLKGDPFQVAIDTAERYPYRFGLAKVERKKLPVGDYALLNKGGYVAIAERKTMDNFLHEIATLDILKSSLEEMSRFQLKAMVFESPYAHFINPKIQKYYSATYIADILADLMVQFQEIQFVFCDSRKTANEWVFRWFKRIWQNIP